MEKEDSLEALRREWEAFLCQRGHKIGSPREVGCILLSRNSQRKVYRWLLLIARGKTRTLSSTETEDLKFHLKRAREMKQDAYVVIKFRDPKRKLLVLPADKALKKRRIPPTKGGIPWND